MKNFKQKFAIVTALCMGLTLFPMNAFAETATDISNHWAKESIQSWMDKGLIKGYKDGTFRPNDNITRAEFMALVNNAFGYTETTDIQYADVNENDWFVEEVAKATAAGYISGYKDNTIKPNQPIKRGEAAAIIMKVIGLQAGMYASPNFTDESNFDWSKEAIDAVTSVNIMSGYPDGSFKAKNLIKRGEAVASLDKAMTYNNAAITNDGVESTTNHAPIVKNQIKDIEGNLTDKMSVILFTPGYEVFTDSDGDGLAYNIKVERDPSAVVKSITSAEGGYFTIIPQGKNTGTATISVTATDGKGGAVTDKFDITFKGSSTKTNHAPVVGEYASIGDQRSSVNDSIRVELYGAGRSSVFIDEDNDSLSYTVKIKSDPNSIVKSITPVSNGIFTIVPQGVNPGSAILSVTADDGNGGKLTKDFNVIFTNPNTGVNHKPILVNQIKDIETVDEYGWVGVILFTPGYYVFVDPDQDFLTYEYKIENDPNSIIESIVDEGDVLKIGHKGNNLGTATISITANDGKGGIVINRFNVTFK